MTNSGWTGFHWVEAETGLPLCLIGTLLTFQVSDKPLELTPGMITSESVVASPKKPRMPDLITCLESSGTPVSLHRDYFGQDNEELSVFLDDDLELLSDAHGYWWLLKDRRSGQVGFVPSTVIKLDAEKKAQENSVKNQEIPVTKAKTVKQKNIKMGVSQKRVSFAKEEPTTHFFEAPVYYDDDLQMGLASVNIESDEDYDLEKSSVFFKNALTDEAVRKVLGIDQRDSTEVGDVVHLETAMKHQDAQLFRSDDSSAERLELSSPQKETKGFKAMISKIWKSSSSDQIEEEEDRREMVKIFSGNFTPLPTYKTCIVDERATVEELEMLAKRLYRIESHEDDYSLSLVHTISEHVLDVRSDYELGIVMEIAKIATVEDGRLLDEKKKPCNRHRKKLPRTHLALLKKRKLNINMRGVKEGFTLLEHGLERHTSSDFPTNYKFVLNKKIAPYVRQRFYVWVELESSDATQQASSRIALSVRPLTTMDEILTRSLKAMDVAQMQGVNYDLVLHLKPSYIHEYKFDPKDGREVLTKEMTVNDVQCQWPHVDPSSFLFILRPYICVGSTSTLATLQH